jgi:hypothetical protein
MVSVRPRKSRVRIWSVLCHLVLLSVNGGFFYVGV